MDRIAANGLERAEKVEKQIEEQQSIQVKFRNLSDGVHPISITRNVDLLDIASFDGSGGELRINGTLTRNGDRLIFDLDLSADGRFECTRCLEPFDRVIETSLHFEFNPPTLGQEDDGINHTFDPTLKPFVDIYEDVRDAVALAIPMKNLCRQECRGICPGCGHDLNKQECICSDRVTEGTWSALKAVQERLRADEKERPSLN